MGVSVLQGALCWEGAFGKTAWNPRVLCETSPECHLGQVLGVGRKLSTRTGSHSTEEVLSTMVGFVSASMSAHRE